MVPMLGRPGGARMLANQTLQAVMFAALLAAVALALPGEAQAQPP